MKIKRKKQLNLPQLIEWAQDNIEEATKKVYRVNENEVLGHHVRFTEVYSDLEVRLHGYIPFDSTFTVEVEEEIEIDEYTVFRTLVKVIEDGTVYTCTDATINREKNSAVVVIYAKLNGVLKLIWTRDKGLVE